MQLLATTTGAPLTAGFMTGTRSVEASTLETIALVCE